MIKVKRALISVSDKSGILEFARELNNMGVEILSTGGTAKLLKNDGIPVREVSEYTGFPEMLDGRVKTLHPKIHGGLLALRDKEEHMQQVKRHKIELIDMVVVNLYPFEKVTQRKNVKLEEAIENIDIGGPSMLRSAAKNYKSVAVICNPNRYKQVIQELKNNKGILSDTLLRNLAVEVFDLTSHYDSAIYGYLNSKLKSAQIGSMNGRLDLSLDKIQDLRYGENPHQKAIFYADPKVGWGVTKAKQLHGKELSFNNILDINAALEIVKDFKEIAAVAIKHTNPCGVATAKKLSKAFKDAMDCDRLSAFGGIIGLNRKVDVDTAREILKSGFLECIIAPGYEPKALELLKAKSKNLRLLELPFSDAPAEPDIKKVTGGLLVQDKDTRQVTKKDLKVATRRKPTAKELESLLFAWKVVKHVKSNAIVLVRDTKTIGIGAGQMSRVDSVIISIRKAGKKARGSIMASDAFFPKEDAVKTAAKAKIRAIIQPGGSIADEKIVKEADKAKISMVFTGFRHFKH
jgi:phosphoribosylaminoimidazolecarboxamide formyltransferase/IMP cyclohydrolase